MKHFYFLPLIFGAVLYCFRAEAQTTVELLPVADNTLYIDPTGSLSNGSGPHFFVGLSQAALTRRGLIRFEPSDSISPYAEITSVELSLYMDMTVSGNNPISLYQVSQAWGEGPTVSAGGGGTGGVVQPGDATWIHTFYPNSFWINMGGDYNPVIEATTNVNAAGYYTWTSATLAATVENWLQNPSSNHGWILIGDEVNYPNAKRFASRENTNPLHRPRLTITYTLACDPADEPVIVPGSTQYCEGDTMLFTIAGNLNNANAWALYADSCGGSPISVSSSGILIAEAAGSGHYFVRGEGGCPDPGNCSSVMITINPPQDASFTYPTATVCSGDENLQPDFTGTPGGTFVAEPPGLQIDEITGIVNVDQSNTGNYIITYTSPGPDCITSQDFSLSVFPVYETEDSVEICMGDAYVFGSQTLTAAGEYTELFASASNCDSTVVLNLFVTGPDSSIHQEDQVITAMQSGASYQWVNCQDNMGPIPGETGQVFTATINGFYAVIVTLDGCSVLSSCVEVTTLSIDTPDDKQPLLKVFPNPVNHWLNVEASTQIDLRILDITGKEVIQLELQPGTHQMNFNQLPAGMYFIEAISGHRHALIPLGIIH